MPTRCTCTLDDCAYYNAVPNHRGQCDCTHPEKAHYLYNMTCPLYRKNWEKTQDKLEELKAKMLGKRRR